MSMCSGAIWQRERIALARYRRNGGITAWSTNLVREKPTRRIQNGAGSSRIRTSLIHCSSTSPAARQRRLIRTEKEVEARREDVWLVVDEDALEQWPAGPRNAVGRP